MAKHFSTIWTSIDAFGAIYLGKSLFLTMKTNEKGYYYYRIEFQSIPHLINLKCIWCYTLELHYNTHFRVHSDISVIAEQPYNEGLIHRKYKQWEPCL